jgi:predicted ribosomally synthesized peptide with SipW-like signal peptide
VVAFVGTSAFFSDDETSTGNTFQAGAIDLLLTNESSASNGVVNASQQWSEFDDINNRVMMNYSDIKPGDWGENTIGFQVVSNQAWMCADITLTDNLENERLQPETLDGDVTDQVGELDKDLMVMWWKDDGDNQLGANETPLFQGPRSLRDWLALGDGTTLPLTFADSSLNWESGLQNDPIDPNVPFYLGVAWCLGDLVPTNDGNPGWTCNGELVNNQSQTDSFVTSLNFSVEQARNNPNFLCPENRPGPTATPVPTPTPIDASGPNEGWNGPGALVWQAESRFGNNGLSGDWEVGVGTNTQSPATMSNTNLTWTSGVSVPFSVNYAAGIATFTVNGNSAVYNVGSITNTADLNIIAGKVSSGAGDSVELTNLELNSIPLNPDSLVDTDNTNAAYLLVDTVDLSGGFNITGDVEFNFTDGTTVGSRPAFQIQVRD